MKGQQKTGSKGQSGHSSGHGREQAATDVSRSRRTSPLLQRLRRARKVKGGYEPELGDGFYDSLQDAPPPKDPRDQPALVKWAQRSAMYALVPLSLIGTATLFVVGFVGSHMIVEYLVGTEYLPTTANAPRQVQPVAENTAPAPAPAPVTLSTTAVPVTPAREAAPSASSKVEERLAQDETQVTAPVTAEVSGTTSIITASAEPTGAAEQPEPSIPANSNAAQPSSAETVAPPEPQTAAVEAVPPEAAQEQVAPSTEPTATKPVVRSLVESVFGLGEATKSVEEAPAKVSEARAVNVEPAGATVSSDTPKAAEPAGNQQAALTINQQDAAQPSQGQGLPDVYRVSRQEAIRMFGDGQRLMAAGDIRQARGLFARSLASGMPEAALALGRSYDPKYVARIENANAAADAEAARNWYEEWYRQSVEQGSISSDVRLDRLLQTMNAN